MVSEFPEILLGILPPREVKFIVDVGPRIEPIFKAPYKLALAEIKELKV